MQLDDLKEAWAAHGRALERSLAIDERLLREVLLRKVRFALAPFVVWRALEVALGVAVLLAAVPVLAAHAGEARYLVAGGALVLCTAALTALCVSLLHGALTLDYAGPLTVIQRELERIELSEYRALKWSLLGGILLWLPAALVLFEALTGVDALARVDLAWLAANLCLGLVVLVLGQLWSRKHVERPDLSPWARRLVDALSGRGLRSAAGHLAELARFEREEPPPAG